MAYKGRYWQVTLKWSEKGQWTLKRSRSWNGRPKNRELVSLGKRNSWNFFESEGNLIRFFIPRNLWDGGIENTRESFKFNLYFIFSITI